MATIMLAVKPKYPTRLAIDKTLLNDDEFIDIVEVNVPIQALALMETSYVAIINNNKYYPIDKDNVYEQYALVAAGEAPTVAEDADFGVKKLEAFISAPTETDEIKKSQVGMGIYNGIIKGTLYKVLNVSNDTNFNKIGYWLTYNADITSATASGYSNAKCCGETITNGTNYLFMGEEKLDAIKKVILFTATYTVGSVSEDIEVMFENRVNPINLEDYIVSNKTSDDVEEAVESPVVEDENNSSQKPELE